MNKTEKYKLRDALEHALFLLKESSKTNEEYNWDEAPVICELNGYRWLLGPEASKEMDWNEAKAWCESVNSELPPREILLFAYVNEDTKHFFKEDWYWSSTEFNAPGAWIQNFGDGYQSYNGKTGGYSVRAVKRVKL